MWDATEDSSPKWRYFSKTGGANILRERLQGLIGENNECLKQEQRRRTYALPPYPPNVTYIANFPLVCAQLVKELREVENEIRQLRIDAGIRNSFRKIREHSSQIGKILNKASLREKLFDTLPQKPLQDIQKAMYDKSHHLLCVPMLI